MDNPPSLEQLRYLNFCKDYIDKHGEFPRLTYIAKNLKRSLSSTHEMLARLKEKGYVAGGYYEPYILIWDGRVRTIKAFKEYLLSQIKDENILEIIMEY